MGRQRFGCAIGPDERPVAPDADGPTCPSRTERSRPVPAGSTVARRAGGSILRSGLAIFGQHSACLVTQDVTPYCNAAAFELSDPVGRQGAFVEFGQLLDVFGTRADQQLVDTGPHRCAEALA